MTTQSVIPWTLATAFVSGVAAAQPPRMVDLAAATRTVRSNGLSFPVVDVGSGPAVLLLHGFPDDRHLWRYQIPALADAGFRVLAPDLRGFGDAPRPTDPAKYGIPIVIRDVLGILDALGVARVQLVAPTTTSERLRLAAERTDGWLYLVSLTGTTGARESLSAQLARLVERARTVTDVPLLAGFGIGTPEHAAAAAALTDGVVVGSRALQVADEAGPRGLMDYVASLRHAVDAVPITR